MSCSRLKKIQEKKKQLRERTEREIEARLAKLGPIAEPANMLTEENDEDLLFEWRVLTEDFNHQPYLFCASLAKRLLLPQLMSVFLWTCRRRWFCSSVPERLCVRTCHCTDIVWWSIDIMCVVETHSVWWITCRYLCLIWVFKAAACCKTQSDSVSPCCGRLYHCWPHITGVALVSTVKMCHQGLRRLIQIKMF